MASEATIRQCYNTLGNHRAVARFLSLPVHYVMFVLGLMPEPLFLRVNSAE